MFRVEWTRKVAHELKRLRVCVLSVAALSGCAADFDSQMTLEGYRVVGIVASPPELSPDESVVVTVHDHYAGAEPLSYAWSLCLYSHGPNDAYDCLEPELEIPADSGTVTLDLSAQGLDLRRSLASLPSYANPDGSERELATGFDVWLKLHSGPECEDCERISSVKRLTLSERSPAERNSNPEISEFEVLGRIARGREVTLRVRTDEPESFRAARDGGMQAEQYLYTWYSAYGKADPTRSFGDTQQTQLQLPNAATTFDVIVTVRDGRGGLAVARQSIVVP